jgi:hypothetical protein
MSRKDDLRMLFNFMIELLKEEEENKTVIKEITDKKLLVEEPKQKTTNFSSFDTSKIKNIMDKIDAKQHENAVVKQALNVQAKDYKKEIEDLREAFNQKLEKLKTEEDSDIIDTPPSLTGGTIYSEFVNKINR